MVLDFVIIVTMSNTLIIGKDLPDSLEFAEVFANSGRKVFVASKPDSNVSNFEAEEIYSTSWNRSSAISARSLIIKAETKIQDINEVIVYFDAPAYAAKFDTDKTENVSAAVDMMISGYQLFINEFLFRLNQRQEKTALSFLVRSCPSKYDMIHTYSYKNTSIMPASNIVISSECAFIALAENIAAFYGDSQLCTVFLAQCNATNELYKNEQEIARWMISSFDALKEPKLKYGVKQATSWNKVGAKLSTGFSLFK